MSAEPQRFDGLVIAWTTLPVDTSAGGERMRLEPVGRVLATGADGVAPRPRWVWRHGAEVGREAGWRVAAALAAGSS